MRADRLEIVCEVLDNLKPTEIERFYMGEWLQKTGCGTKACAIGHACMDDRIASMGLNLVIKSNSEPNSFIPKYSDYYETIALAKFFEISIDQVHEFFYPSAYGLYADEITPQQVSNRIKEFLKESECSEHE